MLDTKSRRLLHRQFVTPTGLTFTSEDLSFDRALRESTLECQMTPHDVSLYLCAPIAIVVLPLTWLAAYIVRKTGDTKGLRDLAELVRAFRKRR